MLHLTPPPPPHGAAPPHPTELLLIPGSPPRRLTSTPCISLSRHPVEPVVQGEPEGEAVPGGAARADGARAGAALLHPGRRRHPAQPLRGGHLLQHHRLPQVPEGLVNICPGGGDGGTEESDPGSAPEAEALVHGCL